jgi:hypothetical protein
MKKLLLILIALPMIGFGQTWEIEYLSNGYDLNTVYFYNDTIGYAVGDNGAMIKTIDAGDNWIDLNGNTTNDITDVMFISEDTGYICTKGGVYTQTHGEILITYNGGNNWSQLYQGSISGVYQSYFKIEKIINGDITIIGYENWINSNNTSISYGRRFNYQTSTNIMNQSNVLMNGGIPYDSYSYSSNSYTLVGGSGMPLGGASWTSTNWIKTNISGINISVNFPTGWSTANSSLYSIDMLDANPINGVTVGSEGKIYNLSSTTSSNNSMVENTSFSSTTIDLWSVDMMNDKGWIVGDLGTILFTVDSGQTWSPYNNPILFEDLHSVVFTDPCKGYFVGENGVVGRYRYEENVSVSLCENSQNLSLFSLLDSNAINLGGVWTDSAGNPISYLINPNTLSIGNHSFYYSFYICNEVKESVINVTVNEMPNLSTTALNNVACYGNNTGMAQVNMLNGAIIYTSCVWSNGSTGPIAPNLIAGTYTVNVTDTNGCSSNSSVIITEPSILTNTTSTVNVICNGGSDGSVTTSANGGVSPYQYTLGGGLSQANGIFMNLFSGMYNLDITDVNGCNIIDSFFISEPNTPSFQPSFTVCEGDNVIVGNSVYNTTGVYTDTLATTNGCDSIVYTSVNVIPTTVWQQAFSICNGDSVLVGNNVYNTAGNYTDTLTTSNGCDSIVYTGISLTAPVIWQQAFSICNDDSIVVGNSVYNSVGNYTDTISSNGCDSIIYTNISIAAPIVWQWGTSICNGDSVIVGNSVYNTVGIYADTLTTSSGCDSIVYTNISIDYNTSSYDTLSVTTSIVWNGLPLSVSGDYSTTLINSVGCDSIVNLNLTVTTAGISDIANTKSNLVKITNMLGQETPYRRNTPLFYIYDDGTVEKRMVIE